MSISFFFRAGGLAKLKAYSHEGTRQLHLTRPLRTGSKFIPRTLAWQNPREFVLQHRRVFRWISPFPICSVSHLQRNYSNSAAINKCYRLLFLRQIHCLLLSLSRTIFRCHPLSWLLPRQQNIVGLPLYLLFLCLQRWEKQCS